MNLHPNPDLTHFLLTIVFSFLVGLEVRTYKERFHAQDGTAFIGTARTFTFVGIIGFVFYLIDPVTLVPYAVVLAGLTLLYALYYRKKLSEKRHSILLYLVLLCVYAFGPLIARFPLWMPSLLFVLIVFILNARNRIHRISLGINPYEFETLGKMILLSAVILPLLPRQNIVPHVPLSPFKIWLAVVVISAISYGGYIAQKYLFPGKGYFLTGLIGGTYSSTATTVVLARKAVSTGASTIVDAAIVAATAVMYLRLLVIAFVFNTEIARALTLPFTVLSAVGMAVAFLLLKRSARKSGRGEYVDSNPLELGTAFVFAALFVLMMMLTQFVVHHYGDRGLEILSFLVGFTDIDPFVLSLLTGKYSVTAGEITAAVMIAAGSNNFLKALYALWFGSLKHTWRSAFLLLVLGVLTIAWAFWLEGIG